MRHTIFVGSSVEHLPIVHAIHANFVHDPDIEVQPWPTLFAPGRSTLENLIEQTEKNDLALLVFAPADQTTIRDASYAAVRDNVIFELGLFAGALGLRRVFWVMPANEAMRVPTDLAGIQTLTYKPPASGNWEAALSGACDTLRRAIGEEDHQRADADPAPLSTKAIESALHITDRALRRFASQGRRAVTVQADDAGLTVRSSRTTPDIHIRFNTLEDCVADAPPHAVIALPVNEFFDDCSVGHIGSTVHAYAHRYFPERIAEFNALVAEQVRRRNTMLVRRDAETYADSLGVAECILLRRPLETPLDVILVSVARMRRSVGIRSEPHYIFASMRRINEVMNEANQSHLYVPLLGSGRGGLTPELSFLCVFLASLELDVEEVTIVVFPRRRNQITPELVRHAVQMTTGAEMQH